MKILFLANRVPFPPYRGDKLKIYNLGLHLRMQHELHLLTLAENKEEHSYRHELEKIFHKVHFIDQPKWRSLGNALFGLWKKDPLQVLYFNNPLLPKILKDWLAQERYDAVHVQHLRMAPYMLPFLAYQPALLDLPDAFSLYWKRRQQFNTNPFTRILERFEEKRLRNYEKKIIGQYPLALVCSSEDQRYLLKEHNLQNVQVLPNGVNLQSFPDADHDYSIPHHLLFTGNMDYAPNVDAVHYFVKDILPLIKKEIPEVHFTIAGQRPVKSVRDLASEDISVTGFVPDLAKVYASATVVVAPLRFGAGTQNKVLEAMAMALPVVCTQVGFEGLNVQQGEGVFKQITSSSFAIQVVDLLNHEELRRSSGIAGQKALRSRMGWETISGKLEQYLKQVATKTH